MLFDLFMKKLKFIVMYMKFWILVDWNKIYDVFFLYDKVYYLDIFLDVDIMFLILVNIRMVIKKNVMLGCKLFFWWSWLIYDMLVINRVFLNIV